MEEKEKLSLINIKGGGAVEMFDRAAQKVFENINDINTTLAAREVNLKVSFKPSEDRTMVAISLQCIPKLAPQDSEMLTADLKLDERGRAVAYERNRQKPLPFATNVKKLAD